MHKIIKQKELTYIKYKFLARAILNNELIIGPSDTVYGLYTVPTKKSVKKIIKFKGRDYNKPVSVFMYNIQHANKFIKYKSHIDFISNLLKKDTKYTFIVKASAYAIKTLPRPIITDSKTIGIRIIRHEFITNIFMGMQKAFNKLMPITATSANISNTMPYCDFNLLTKSIPKNKLKYIKHLIDYGKLQKCNNLSPHASTLIDISKGLKNIRFIKR